MIRLATKEDLGKIVVIFAIARRFMEATGNPNQWGKSRPSYDSVVKDIAEEKMWVIAENDEIVGVFSLFEYDKDYDNIMGEWLNDEPYVAIHKVASNGKSKGIFSKILEFAKTKSNNIRIDTHKDNRIMQLHIKKNRFKYCGIVLIEGNLERLAYHLSLN